MKTQTKRILSATEYLVSIAARTCGDQIRDTTNRVFVDDAWIRSTDGHCMIWLAHATPIEEQGEYKNGERLPTRLLPNFPDVMAGIMPDANTPIVASLPARLVKRVIGLMRLIVPRHDVRFVLANGHAYLEIVEVLTVAQEKQASTLDEARGVIDLGACEAKCLLVLNARYLLRAIDDLGIRLDDTTSTMANTGERKIHPAESIHLQAKDGLSAVRIEAETGRIGSLACIMPMRAGTDWAGAK
jgi:hypothetical protein